MDEPDSRKHELGRDRVAEPRPEYGKPVLTEQYLRWIDEIERMQDNQSGQDKSWLRERMRLDAEHLARVKRVR
ncbi:MAG: hypothetical protein HZA53_10565 [Planctomycetes bacterium]|nr:hypothetical protein [Planctomycetota bacterium]